ncbi:MAG: ABC transporter ATP-binding protein [Acidobacteria bacterium]|nr:MAG: ABC transporter ATP-binding protein [Acidobacteriota bacterium]PYQ68127.1 MAG: ABC transporter ATP-binding protein [Acidobacteriota bacterium]
MLKEPAPAEAGKTPKIRVEDLHKSFDGKVVLDGVNFSLPEGESLVVVGPSGTGKSVLLKHLIGLVRPDSGRLFVDGRDFWALSDLERTAVRKKFGMSFQEGALFDSMSVFDNVAFPLRRSGRPPSEVRERVRECLSIVHLPNVEGKRPSELSGGMRRRVGFARAIAHEPEILLFDEPNTGLDPIMTDVIDEVILEMKEKLDVTIVTITHHMESARKIGDRVALLAGGKLLYQAPPEEFLKSDDPAVRQFVEGKAEGPLTVEFERETATAAPEAS